VLESPRNPLEIRRASQEDTGEITNFHSASQGSQDGKKTDHKLARFPYPRGGEKTRGKRGDFESKNLKAKEE